ncbi:SWI/SNF-related matrix-associated actin-dependent regulator of chromatin subfamily A member 5 [Fistulifera solaris]|uniref:SWI/SNF-related matrix-associated actin-dependent regulator of chromatin subfamily A member 5 n=1 Tax=Fistulifera solaris TaxID=1519565 RepID=A0A1Z5JJT7_FISSO|nr:SWI/SNF-related matrix-associated actin-dependent regulator of chromatin subfamily A member 5 [Fistulifera solaris]|eukprot:GAX14112.1 SWI/SNF-related matrix-associated actin-dependent regulator of chromatin subfamily A member 5 [Fistulifera solaris]
MEDTTEDAPAPVRKIKTAFLYYQGDQLSKIRAEMGLSMGDAMTQLAARWRNLSAEEKQPYLDQEEADRERFRRESAEADAKAMAIQEARRQALSIQDGEDHTSRGARRRVEQMRELKQQNHREPTWSAEVLERRAQQQAETAARREERARQEEELKKKHRKLDKEESKKAAQRLEYLLAQSSIFSRLQDKSKAEGKNKENGKARQRGAHHIHDKDSTASDEEVEDEEENGSNTVFLSQQPSCIKFGQLKPYQLESLNWMIHLSEKGLNGILADEMGLGKTLQSISIMAYHYEYKRSQGPHLICVPKSTLSNWMKEIQRWCPALRVIKFHGSREDREEMVDNFFTNEAAAHDGRRPDKQIMNGSGELIDDNTDNPRAWDVCITTYEIANMERKTLQKFTWQYLVIDEAHRLKNDASMFSKTVRSFRTSNRLLLTGTPLQNNLHELWALLNFLLPDIFSSAEQFDEWFDLEIEDEEAKKQIISQLHKILRPFMLRRLKSDVAKGLPPKTETILYVGMSKMQKQLYKQLLMRDLDSITGNASSKNHTTILNIVMQLRKCCGHPYLFEGVEDRSLDPLGEHLVENCGKLSMVDKLLKRLKERGDRVLIFTQMTRVLDILEDFMFMRGYQYCRIDGNTNYDDRESQIEEFNRPGSEKFCFLLSTRAGGLGINLQTANICILYDSDWNPQQDLQAQDRCHRLGQKKPVTVFRLVSENTIEEKIVERAQQKLKLDAMVVQQGRLKDKDKVTKEEILAAVRFGADTIFRSEESTITDEDIDVILQRGEAKTKELAERLQKADKGDLLDFRLDGGISAQTFEGVDYSDKDLRDHLRMLAANSVGKRERRPPPSSYNPIIQSKKSMIVNNKRIKLPKPLRLPQMEDHHFYNRERLLELGELEFENYAALREKGQLPAKEVIERNRSLLPPEMAQEKRELMEEGFGEWSRSQYYHFVKACAKYGRHDIASIAADMDMPEEAVAPYSEAFWKYGPTELKNEWERVLGNIERGEKKLAKQKKLSGLLTKFVQTFDNPRHEMVFANKGTTHFALEQDRALLCAVEKHGYGNWDLVREEIRTDNALKFQHSVQGMSVQAIAKRCDYRMRQMEKELEAREKMMKSRKPANVLAAQRAVESIREMDLWDIQAREAELEGEVPPPISGLSETARSVLQERLTDRAAHIARLREIEVQVQKCALIAEETRQAILRGDQYVNYSSITLKSATGPSGKDDTKPAGPTIQDGIEIERLINPLILKIPACRQCENCNTNTKLCYRRLEERERLLAEETAKRLGNDGVKKTKKRKHGDSLATSSPKKAASSSYTVKPLEPPKKKKKLLMQKADGQLKVRVTSQGNKRMTIPDEVFPEFVRRVGLGTGERVSVINQFVEDYPTISARQVTLKFQEICTKDRPKCVPPELTPKKKKKMGRTFMFYLRPCFYKHLDPEVRPPGWEAYAEADEIEWQRELTANPRPSDHEEGRSPDKLSSSGSVTSNLNDSQVMEDVDHSVDDASGTGEEGSGFGEDASGTGDDPMDTGDETEDEE